MLFMNKIREIRRQRGMTQKELAKAMNTTDMSVSRYERGETQLSVNMLKKFAEVLGCDPSDIIEEELSDLPSQVAQDVVFVPEYNVEVSAGNGFIIDSEAADALWPFSRKFLSANLGVSLSDLVMVRVEGDSMEPTLRAGDHILINTQNKRISQPGVFVLWDGDGVVVKRVELIPGSNPPRLLRISDNPLHTNYEALVEETEIVGRVALSLRVM